MIRVLTVFGTRPEAIKLSPVIEELERTNAFESIVCVTGQHSQLLDQALKLFKINPKINLNLMTPNQDLAYFFSKAFSGIIKCINDERPDLLIVQGDTHSALAAAFAGFHTKTKVVHVEAGLRTGVPSSPFPEETNRTLIADLAAFHFAPTLLAKKNLLREGIPEERIEMTGNTIVDALNMILERMPLQTHSNWLNQLDPLGAWLANSVNYGVITCHRRENFGSGISNVCQAVKQIALEFPSFHWVFALHPNPNIQNIAEAELKGLRNVFLTPGLEYLDFIRLISNCKLIVSDSGGIQEEAVCLRKKVLLLRTVTEREEAIASGLVKIVGVDPEKILSEVKSFFKSENSEQSNLSFENPYGNGTAAKKIVARIVRGIDALA